MKSVLIAVSITNIVALLEKAEDDGEAVERTTTQHCNGSDAERVTNKPTGYFLHTKVIVANAYTYRGSSNDDDDAYKNGDFRKRSSSFALLLRVHE